MAGFQSGVDGIPLQFFKIRAFSSCLNFLIEFSLMLHVFGIPCSYELITLIYIISLLILCYYSEGF